MSAPVITPSVVGTSTPALAPVLQVDLSRGTTIGVGTWVTVFGQRSIKIGQETGKTDNSDADTGRWTSQAVTTLGRTVEVELERKSYAGAFDPGQEELRAIAKNDPPLLVHYRTFDRYGRADGNEEGFAVVEWSPSGGGQADTAKVQAVLTVQGAPTSIANPWATATAPVLTSATPNTAVATGKPVVIRGSNLLGVTSVKFGAGVVAAGDYIIINDTTITANALATTGSQPVTVVNPTGTSNSIPFTHV
jgi:hypothetical protein